VEFNDRTYDDANRLTSVVNRDGGTTISSYIPTLDAVGSRSHMVDTSGTTTCSYDDRHGPKRATAAASGAFGAAGAVRGWIDR
jgi:hypothetical protein